MVATAKAEQAGIVPGDKGRKVQGAGASVGGKRESHTTFGHIKNHYPNSDPELVTAVIEATTKALFDLQKGEISRHYEMAQLITENLVETRGGAWHTMVGKSFGSFVTHEDKCLVYISIGQIFVMTFKHG